MRHFPLESTTGPLAPAAGKEKASATLIASTSDGTEVNLKASASLRHAFLDLNVTLELVTVTNFPMSRPLSSAATAGSLCAATDTTAPPNANAPATPSAPRRCICFFIRVSFRLPRPPPRREGQVIVGASWPDNRKINMLAVMCKQARECSSCQDPPEASTNPWSSPRNDIRNFFAPGWIYLRPKRLSAARGALDPLPHALDSADEPHGTTRSVTPRSGWLRDPDSGTPPRATGTPNRNTRIPHRFR